MTREDLSKASAEIVADSLPGKVVTLISRNHAQPVFRSTPRPLPLINLTKVIEEPIRMNGEDLLNIFKMAYRLGEENSYSNGGRAENSVLEEAGEAHILSYFESKVTR